MKKLVRVITAAILSVGFIGGVASAQEAPANACDEFTIINTGNGAENTINCEDVQDITINCVNNVLVANITYQEGVTGNATVIGNDSEGGASTGTVTNTNETTTELGVEGCGAGEVTPTPTPSPEVPGKGSVTPASVEVEELPDTAANNSLAIVAGSLAAAAGIVGLSRAGVAAYRRFNK